MQPDWRSRICGSTALIQRTAPKQFVFITAIMDDSGNSSTDPWTSMPALFTSTSMGSAMDWKQAFTDSSESTSKGKILIDNFSLAAVCASCGARSGCLIVAKTWCPARASSSAVAKPIPELQPVTRTLGMYGMVPRVLPNCNFELLEEVAEFVPGRAGIDGAVVVETEEAGSVRALFKTDWRTSGVLPLIGSSTAARSMSRMAGVSSSAAWTATWRVA